MIVDLRQENAPWITRRIAITENLLKMLDRPQPAPDSRRQTGETHGPILKTLRKLQHVYEILQRAGQAAVVFRHDDVQTGGFRTASANGWKDSGFLA